MMPALTAIVCCVMSAGIGALACAWYMWSLVEQAREMLDRAHVSLARASENLKDSRALHDRAQSLFDASEPEEPRT